MLLTKNIQSSDALEKQRKNKQPPEQIMPHI